MKRRGILGPAGLAIAVVAGVLLRTPDRHLQSTRALQSLVRTAPGTGARTADRARAILLERIYFDFDQAELRPEDRQVLDRKIPILLANHAVHIRIAGCCDERGSEEYNLALGRRRAEVAAMYLRAHGIDASRIEAASYGKYLALDPAHNDEAWAENRRDEFELTEAGAMLEMSQ